MNLRRLASRLAASASSAAFAALPAYAQVSPLQMYMDRHSDPSPVCANINATDSTCHQIGTIGSDGKFTPNFSGLGSGPGLFSFDQNGAFFLNTSVVYAAQYGAKCDNSHADHDAIQSAINHLVATGGGTLVLPAGKCVISSGLTIDLSSYSGQLKPTVNVRGQGMTVSQIVANGISGPALHLIGSQTEDEMNVHLEGFMLVGNTTSASVGLQIDYGAFINLRDVSAQGFVTGWQAANVEQASIEHSNFRMNTNGVNLQGAVGTGGLTGANSISFYDTAISNNTATGLTVVNFASVVYYTGSIQYNGSAGPSGDYGAYFADSTGGSFCGYNAVAFIGTAFEGNGGAYDLGVNSSFCPGAEISITGGTSFLRTTGHYATNNILMMGTVSQNLHLSGSNFINTSNVAGGYTESASRPVISLTNSTANVFDDGSSYFQSTTEQPAFATAHPGGPFQVAGGASIVSGNPTRTALEPLELRGSEIHVDTLAAQGATCNDATGTLSTSATGCPNVVQSVATGGTGDTGTAWTAYTPTLACTSGTLTTATATGRYKTIGKTAFLQVHATITTGGTCSGSLNVSLPGGQTVNSTGSLYPGAGENASTGAVTLFSAASSVNAAQFFFASAPAANQYYGTVTYELQ